MNLKCVVIDDEQPAIDVLENYISRVPDLSLEAKFTNALEALTFLNSNELDLLFIDIQMPDISGMDFLNQLEKRVNFVFTTAYPEYALEGYDFNPLDFLVKPISFDKFMRAVERAKSLKDTYTSGSEMALEDFYIKSKGKNIRLISSDILFIEGLKDYVIFYTKDAKHIALHSMKELEDKLAGQNFIRVHKSYIVDAAKIEEIGGNQIKIGESQIPIGRQYKATFLKFIQSKKL